MATPVRRPPDPVERLSLKIKTLLNTHLKDILRAEGLPVSGVKNELINRLQAHIQALANRGDTQRIQHILSQAERGQGATSSSSPAPSYSPNGLTTSSRPSYQNAFAQSTGHSSNGYNSYASMQTKAVPGQIPFKRSPFFTVVESLVPTKELKARENTRDTTEVEINLNPSVASRLQNDQSLRIMVYCAADTGLGIYQFADIAFPHQVELKCNLDEVKANLRGLKNKPGSTRPADITSLIRKKPGYPNKLTVTYALTTKAFPAIQRYFLVINLAQKHSVEQLVQKIKVGKVISKEQVIREMQKQANDTEIVAVSSVMSLKCPLSTLRMEVPCRSTQCNHNQCFDASSFLQLQEQAPTWTCPVCNKAAPYETLAMDLYVDDVLKTTARNIEQVTVEPDGVWSKNAAPTTPENSGPSASSPDDDDSDLVEIYDSRIASLKQEYTPASSIHRTPPYASREPSIASSSARPMSSAAAKRPIIDLTESDDEDVPVRPIKRPSLAPPGPGAFNKGVNFQLPRPTSMTFNPPPGPYFPTSL